MARTLGKPSFRQSYSGLHGTSITVTRKSPSGYKRKRVYRNVSDSSYRRLARTRAAKKR